MPEIERMSKRPDMVNVAEAVAGCRSATLETTPLPLRMATPTRRRRAKAATHSRTSLPAASSRMMGRIEESLSRVMTTGGFGLFFEPAECRFHNFLSLPCLRLTSSHNLQGNVSRLVARALP